ncbi:hypothetical protein [Fluviicola sp.]|uniref:hypothetical protein n=1 Tax=Fluviicola sp. TaxID=1917219 RepID=UPI00282E5F35|nr:hypothetical protein [Fluviicola sp.]MDR0802822.1 hypothetical protein [Fluviicola sp.]
MKKFIFILLGCSTFLANAQVEAPPAPKEYSPLITLATNSNNSSVVDFNSVNWNDYPNTTGFDLSRITPLSWLQDAAAGSWSDFRDLPLTILEIDGEPCSMEGIVKLVSVQDQDIVLGEITVKKAKRLEIEEQYTLSMNGNTLAAYNNHYFAYFDGAGLIFEVFSKQQDLGAGLGQAYEGISFNIEDPAQQQDIHLVLTPNPCQRGNKPQANFDLWADGYVSVSISDQLSQFNKVVFGGNLLKDSNSVIISAEDYPAGIYVVSVLFQGQVFSANLIIQ